MDNKRVLFVCYANENRSPKAEEICKEIAKQNNLKIKTDSAGISPAARKKLTRTLARQSDLIFVMEDYMKHLLEKQYNQHPEKIICLDIQDIYPKNDPELESILKRDLRFYLLRKD